MAALCQLPLKSLPEEETLTMAAPGPLLKGGGDTRGGGKIKSVLKGMAFYGLM